MASIEVEFRAQLSEQKYKEVRKLLDSKAKFLSKQDQASYYFHDSGKSFKMVHDKDSDKVRIAHKAKTIIQGNDFEEFEITIGPSEIDTALWMFKSLLGISRVIYDEQKRVNYEYQALEVALKWSEGWGYHIEIEKLIENESDVGGAEKQINSLAKSLGIELMTTKDIKLLEKEILHKLETNQYKVAKYV